MSIFKSTPKEQATQLLFRDDGTFIFRKLDVEDGFLVERDTTDNIVRAWMLHYKLLKRFNGFKDISADRLTISYNRDIVLDLFDQLSDVDKPSENGKFKRDYIRHVAEAKCYQHEQKAKPTIWADRMTMWMGAVMVLLALGIGVAVAF